MQRGMSLLCVSLCLVVPSGQASAQSLFSGPVVIQGAMAIEVEGLYSQLENRQTETIGGWTFWTGTFNGRPIVVSRALRGMSNAAAATAIAIQHYRPAAIINQGTAGGHDPALHVANIVIGTSAVNIGAFRTPFRASGTGSDPLVWMPLDLTTEGSAANAAVHTPARFQADADLLDAARRARATFQKATIVEGIIGSSDVWNDELDLIAKFHRALGTAVEEMETASAAQVAALFHVPFIGIRVVSDNSTNGEAYDPKTSEACEAFAIEVTKAYLTAPKR
jgi:adenosylhomocysteine nucleosidase